MRAVLETRPDLKPEQLQIVVHPQSIIHSMVVFEDGSIKAQMGLPDMKLPYGMFGENFTTQGLFEDKLNVGDRLRVGKAELVVTEPRLPCYKLGIKFGRVDIIKRFLQSRRTGFYFAVLKEGEVKAGDEIELLSRDENEITISDITRLYAFEKGDRETLRRVVKLEALSESWRDYFLNRLQKLSH